MEAVGLIEVSGYVTSVEALDAMLKAADVEFLTCEKNLGGRLVTIIIGGNVSSVSEAIKTAKGRAEKVGKVVCFAVIANPHEEIMRMIELSASKLPQIKGANTNEF